MANLPQSVEDLFEAALDLPLEERPAFLDRACYNQPLLRRMTEELLAEDARAGSFLAQPIFDVSTCLADDTSNSAGPRQAIPAAPRFQPNHVIAHRFIVICFLARGGMGEVYEVEDLWLHGTHVALKVIRPEIAADAAHARRFEQEVLLARKVTHPNLCPIYEIFRCDDPSPPFLFLTMKLLVGDTLATRLHSSQPLSRADRELVATELVCAVAALHAGGIIHRDIKPGNVMLDTTTTPFRVALMDFGLARLREAEPTVLGIEGGSDAIVVAGTPGYLAPELLRGDQPNEATDLFALGIVLHQVFTGTRPSHSPDGNSVHASTSLRACGAPTDIIRLVEALLSSSPDRRQRAFEHLHRSLNTQRSPLRISPQMSRRTLAVAAGAALCSVAAGAAWKFDTIHDLFHPLPPKRFVALLSWPPGADLAMRSTLTGVLDAIANELTRAEALDHNFYIAPPISSEVSTPAQLDQLRQSLGANLVLAASGTIQADHFRMLLQLMDPSTHQILRTRTLVTARDHVFSLAADAVRAATDLLDLHHFRPSDRRSRTGTQNAQALAAFQAAEALRKQPNDTGADAAIDKYRLAVDLDPHFAEAHARLAGTYLHLYGSRHDASFLTLGRANAETALVLDPESIQGHTALAAFFNYTGVTTSALDQMAQALALDPSNPFTIRTQAQIYAGLDRWQEAEQAYSRLLRARPNYWSAYHELGISYNMHGRYAKALEAFQAAAAISPKRAICFNSVASVLFQLGRLPEALTAVDTSLSLARTSMALETRTDILRLLGRHTEALQASAEAVQLSPEDSLAWLELGDSHTMLGHPAQQRLKAYTQAATLQASDLQASPADGPGWMLLALYRMKSGQPAEVPALLIRAEALNAADIDSQLTKIRVQELLGQRDAALATLAACLHRGATKYQLQAIVDLAPLREDPRYKSLIAPQETA